MGHSSGIRLVSRMDPRPGDLETHSEFQTLALLWTLSNLDLTDHVDYVSVPPVENRRQPPVGGATEVRG